MEKEFLDSIIENIPNMIFIKSADGLNFEMINKAGEQLLGHSKEEILGRMIMTFSRMMKQIFLQKMIGKYLKTGNY